MKEHMFSGHLGIVTEQVNEYLARGAWVRPGSLVVTYHPEQKCMVMVCVVAWETLAPLVENVAASINFTDEMEDAELAALTAGMREVTDLPWKAVRSVDRAGILHIEAPAGH